MLAPEPLKVNDVDTQATGELAVIVNEGRGLVKTTALADDLQPFASEP